MDKRLRGIFTGLLLFGFWSSLLCTAVLAQVPRKLPRYVAEEPLFPTPKKHVVSQSHVSPPIPTEETVNFLMQPVDSFHVPVDLRNTKKFSPPKESFSVQLDKHWSMPERKTLSETGQLGSHQVTQYLVVNPSGLCSITIYSLRSGEAPTPDTLLLWATRMTQIKGQVLHQGRFWQSGLPGVSLLFYNASLRIYGRFQFLLNSVSHSSSPNYHSEVYQYGCMATEREILYSESFAPLFQTFQVAL